MAHLAVASSTPSSIPIPTPMVYEANRSSTTSGSPSTSAGFGLLDDVPPAYDSISESVSVTGGPSRGSNYPLSISPDGVGSSSAAAAPPSRQWPETMDLLFTGPPHAEPMITRDAIDAGPEIEMRAVGGRNESWDPKLNDPNVLYDFIRAQTLGTPGAKIRCYATRTEVSTRQQTVIENGVPRSVQVGTTYQVTDFDFFINLAPVYDHPENKANVALFATRPHIPAYRGSLSKTYGRPAPPGAGALISGMTGRKANSTEVSMWQRWRQNLYSRGRAPWTPIEGNEELFAEGSVAPGRIALGTRPGTAGTDEEALLGSTTHGEDHHERLLRAWCEQYCSDPGWLKSFTLTKNVWGWDIENLRTAIERAIISAGYQPTANIRILIEFEQQQVVIRPANRLVEAIYTPIVFFFLVITLIYPIIWIWQRWNRYGGGPYEVATATYGMKVYPPLPATFRQETIEMARDRLPAMFKLHPEVPRNPLLLHGPKGIHYLLGRREGEWFREWEERIRFAVRMGYKGELVDTRVNDGNEEPPELDGY